MTTAANTSIAILVYGEPSSYRDALQEEKYKDLATALIEKGFTVRSVLYHDDAYNDLQEILLGFDAILVWVNPIEQGGDRKKLDLLLTEIASRGCIVSTHPDVILRMGTKDILFKTKDMDWGGDTNMYASFTDFIQAFPPLLKANKIRVLKQYRGNGGNGVFKITDLTGDKLKVTHAIGNEEKVLTLDTFFAEFEPFFDNGGFLIDQPWNKNIKNGMVRCYVCGTKVAGFGYQEINALYESDNGYVKPSKRYYFSENCALFSDLKSVMENKWIPELQIKLNIEDTMMPVIWDADFFINKLNSPDIGGKYTLCEINVSCVSPFPPSAIEFITQEVGNRIDGRQ